MLTDVSTGISWVATVTFVCPTCSSTLALDITPVAQSKAVECGKCGQRFQIGVYNAPVVMDKTQRETLTPQA